MSGIPATLTPYQRTRLDALGPKQVKFVDAYLGGAEPAEAAVQAGYKVKSAAERAAEMLAEDHVVQKFLVSLVGEAAANLGVDEAPAMLPPAHEEVPSDYQGWTEGQIRAELERSYLATTDPKAKVRVLELMLKHKGMLKEHKVHDVGGTLADLITQASERRREKEAKAIQVVTEPRALEPSDG